jgi:hypothetical protein
MLNVLDDIISTLRSLDRGEQERAAQVLLAWLNGASEFDLADA